MARTPLLRFIQGLAREHNAAERLRITPAELRERRAGGAMSRRQFLKGSAAAALAATIHPGMPKAAGGEPRIAIIGAGISGLNAALTLQDKGIASTVYEAAPRIGGRMKSETSYWANGQVGELYGELIDTGHTSIRALAGRFGLPLTDQLAAEPAGSTETYYFFGERYPAAQADIDFEPVRTAAKRDLTAAGYPTLWNKFKPAGQALDNMSIYQWIQSRVPGGTGSPFGRLLDVAYNIEYGAESVDQSALNLLYLLAYQPAPSGFSVLGVSDEKFHIEGGNERLPKAIAAVLPDVRTGWRMTRIAANGDGSVGLDFTTPSGARNVTADRVILTTPFPVLRGLDIAGAGFDQRKLVAINELGGGRNSKLLLQFTDRHWNQPGPWGLSNGGSYADTGFQNAWDTTRGQPGSTGILVNYTGGDTAGSFTPLKTYSTAANTPQIATYARSFLRQLEPVFPGITPKWNGRATLSTPQRDPNFLCSYSYFRVGQYTKFCGYERVPQGSIHFAGEHCSQDFQGYMEGGVVEGARAALEVFHALAGN